MQGNLKCPYNMDIIGIPEGEEEQGIENLFEKVLMENFPNLMREKSPKSEKQRVPSKRNPKRHTARHVIIKNGKIPRQREDIKGNKGET